MKLHYRRCHVNNEWIHPVWCGMDRCDEKKPRLFTLTYMLVNINLNIL